MASLFAIEAVRQTSGLPVNIKFLFEGQEEIGSRELESFIKDHQDLLSCDFSLNPDAGMLGADLPTLTYALRGLMDCELRFFGPTIDQHSGLYGGAIHNPAQALCEVVAGMHDENGRVTLPGFYDSVRPISAEERAELSRLPMDDAYFRGPDRCRCALGRAGLSGSGKDRRAPHARDQWAALWVDGRRDEDRLTRDRDGQDFNPLGPGSTTKRSCSTAESLSGSTMSHRLFAGSWRSFPAIRRRFLTGIPRRSRP